MNRGAFYHRAQDGRCYLRITPYCQHLGGVMQLLSKDERRQRAKSRHMRDDASWDHIYPKPRTAEQEPVQLLACNACNNKRGAKPATAEHIALAETVLEAWRAHSGWAVPGSKSKRRAERQLNRAKVRALQLMPEADETMQARIMVNMAMADARVAGHPFCLVTAKRRLTRAAARREGRRPGGRSLAQERVFMVRVKAGADALDDAKKIAALRGAANKARASGHEKMAHNLEQAADRIAARGERSP